MYYGFWTAAFTRPVRRCRLLLELCYYQFYFGGLIRFYSISHI